MDGSPNRFAKLDRECEDSCVHVHDQSAVIKTRTLATYEAGRMNCTF